MAEQKLDVRVSESGTATVVSTLEKLEKKLGDVEKAQQAETATTEKAVATLGKMSDGLAAFFDRQSSKMAVIEKAAGLLGKFNLAFELVGKAIKAGEYILDNYIRKVQSLEPALEGVNTQLREQLKLYKQIRDEQGATIEAGGTLGEAAQAGKLRAEIELLKARQGAILDEATAVAGTDRTKLGGPGFGSGGLAIPALIDQLQESGSAFDKARLDELEQERKLNDNQLFKLELDLEKLRADIKTRERGTGAGPPKPEPTGGGGGGGTVVESMTGGEQLQAATEALSGGAVNLQNIGAVISATAELQSQLDSTAASWAELGEAALDAGADMRRAVAQSIVSAALQGKSIVKVLGQELMARSQKYLVDGTEWGLKAAGLALFGSPGAGAAAAISAGYFAAAGTAAGLGAIMGGGGGGGGGRGGGGGGTAPAVGATGPRAPAQADAGGPLTVNVTIDGLAISTADSIAAGVVGALQRAAETPGMRGRLNRAMGGRA